MLLDWIEKKSKPLTKRRIQIFRKNKIAVYSLYSILAILFFSCIAEFIANDRPYVMKFNGKWYFPVISEPNALDLGISGQFTVEYDKLNWEKDGNFRIRSPFHFNPYESNPRVVKVPGPPTLENPFGTDDRGRDVFTRLLYGFRISFFYAIGVWIITYLIGTAAGLVMGYFGGKIDFLGQRVVEILTSIPQFFLLIILVSIFNPSIYLLIAITSVFGWIGISYYMRAEALRLRKLEFVEAARALGEPTSKILFKHVLPNALTPLIAFSPFAIAAAVTSLAALDYLGFGLSPPTPSWGELLNQARRYFTHAWWLAVFPSLALFSTLCLLIFVGEGLRNAFDPKK